MKADIFFFVTTVSVVLILIMVGVLAYYLMQILRNFRDISETLKKGVHHASNHIEDLSDRVSSSPIFNFVFGKKKKSRKKGDS